MHKGKCLCGAVTYSFEGEPISVGLCHCKDCQRASGTLFQHVIVLRKTQLNINGELSSYAVQGGNDVIERKFCPKCGSGVLMEPHAAPKAVLLKGGTLDNPAHFKPARQVFAADKPDWLQTIEGLPTIEGAPEYK